MAEPVAGSTLPDAGAGPSPDPGAGPSPDAVTGASDDSFPGADVVTPAAVVTEVRRPVAGLSRWITGAHAAAARTGRTLYVLTGDGARITYPLELLLSTSHAARWIVRLDDGRWQDGLSGQAVRWDGRGFTAATDRERRGDRGAVAAAPSPQLYGPGSLRVDITRLYPAAGTVEIGGTAAAAAAALTGAGPAGWGTAEPVTEPWSPPDLTAFARERAPGGTSVVIAGGNASSPAAGVLQAEPATAGVHTRVRLAVGTGRFPGPQLDGALGALAEALAADGARAMLVAWQPGIAGATRATGPQPPSVPVGLLAGHEIVAARGVKHAQQAPAESTVVVGSGSRRACWCRFGTATPNQALVEVMNHFRKW